MWSGGSVGVRWTDSRPAVAVNANRAEDAQAEELIWVKRNCLQVARGAETRARKSRGGSCQAAG